MGDKPTEEEVDELFKQFKSSIDAGIERFIAENPDRCWCGLPIADDVPDTEP